MKFTLSSSATLNVLPTFAQPGRGRGLASLCGNALSTRSSDFTSVVRAALFKEVRNKSTISSQKGIISHTWIPVAPGQWPGVELPPSDEQELVEMHSPVGPLSPIVHILLGLDDGCWVGVQHF